MREIVGEAEAVAGQLAVLARDVAGGVGVDGVEVLFLILFCFVLGGLEREKRRG